MAPRGPELRTAQLLLRRWRDSDRAPFAALNADEDVMRYFPARRSREESDAFVDSAEAHFDREGFGWWAVEVPGHAPFVGFVGLQHVSFAAHFTPAVEVGWRLAKEHWGRGYATEAAEAALAFGFREIGLNEIVAFTPEENWRSRAVMERLGMKRDPNDDFGHPRIESAHLRLHVLYRRRQT